MEKKRGIIKRYNNKGYGFIVAEDGKDIFFHFCGLLEPRNFKDLRCGMPVEFIVLKDLNGKDQAIGIKEIKTC